MFKWNFLHFNLFPLPLSCHWPPLKRPWFHFVHSLSSGVYTLSFLQAQESQLFQPLLVYQVLWGINLNFTALHRICSSMSISLVHCRDWNWTQHTRCLIRAEQSGLIISLNLLATRCLKHWEFISALCPKNALLPARIPKAFFPAELLSSRFAPSRYLELFP